MARLVRWTPVAPTIDRFFDDLWSTFPASYRNGENDQRNGAVAPAMDIIEHEDRVELHVNLPGIASDDVNIEFHEGVLTIATVEVELEEGEAPPKYTRRERYAGAYKRSLRVPDTLDTENAAADFENGVLYLTLPKKPEAQPIRIPVNAAAK